MLRVPERGPMARQHSRLRCTDGPRTRRSR